MDANDLSVNDLMELLAEKLHIKSLVESKSNMQVKLNEAGKKVVCDKYLGTVIESRGEIYEAYLYLLSKLDPDPANAFDILDWVSVKSQLPEKPENDFTYYMCLVKFPDSEVLAQKPCWYDVNSQFWYGTTNITEYVKAWRKNTSENPFKPFISN